MVQTLLKYFEDFVKSQNKTWIYLNSTKESNNFYIKNGFRVNPFGVNESVKDL